MQSVMRRAFFLTAPFIIYSAFRTVLSVYPGESDSAALYTGFFAVIVSLMLVALQLKVKEKNYFTFAVLGALVYFTSVPGLRNSGVKSFPYIKELVEFTIKRPESVLYLSFFLMASLPPLLGREPFTYYFAKPGVPEIFWGTKLFKYVNLVINWFWAVIFALCLTSQFMDDLLHTIVIPVILQLVVGAPATKFLIPYLQRKLAFVERGAPRDFLKTAEQAVTGMPYVFNRKAAGNLDIVIQFFISGSENIEGYLDIRGGECTYYEGIHPAPAMTMKAPADVYLKIAKNEMSGTEAFFNKLITIEGDLSIALRMDDIFGTGPSAEHGKSKGESRASKKLKGGAGEIRVEKNYHRMEPGEAKRVLLIQGSPRKKGTSKTAMVAEAFLEGCRSAGAETETLHLAEKNINSCAGCYSCWTRTPGRCVFNDDAAEIMRLENGADLVVYATPLYVFGIISTLKRYLDRKIPMLEPYLVKGENGSTFHPVRDGWKKSKNIAVLGACGFPEVENFDAVSAYFHFMSNFSGGKGVRIVTEIYRPASEILGIGFYREETERVLSLARLAGEQIVTTGSVEPYVTAGIAEVKVDYNTFREQANKTWDICINEGKTLPQVQEEFLRGEPEKSGL